ncbi:hypothetical protein HS1genome_0863 [Sulfodiicoccus acidiphilus]|uniref:DUF460 domain-containing protein n=1 Tax=Sulfodiicoccus acidiphilus TaxID=1670455 RepID=A0A348B2S2_9CREN|nr:DUF460 domain-containing protein [Sulfodiicoccus acidiphilus]BBD72474.1 hypothetical protein HS1genome_0863 [Sulfodiicoccus acidiphilus]GGT96873.1 hypothetical protein GCM10007116_12960 [Sulfodiicoccus acidiphilus]
MHPGLDPTGKIDERTLVMGVDIEPGSSPNSVREAKYSVAIIDGKERVVTKLEGVPTPRLVRLIWDYRPRVLALDNVFELGGDERGFRKVMEMLPDNLQVVQVTYVDGEFLDIREIARRTGIEVRGKTDPLETAVIAARLALRNVGTGVKVVENRTKIIISKSRKYGPGGMSQNRFKRRIRGLLLQATRDIKSKLDAHGFDYDVFIRRSKSGLEGAMFVVYSPREALYGIVKKVRTHDLSVDVRPVYTTRVKFSGNRRKSDRPLVVGVDPGLEVGISVLDLQGAPVLLTTKRAIDREEILSIISQYGVPILVATDVNPVPDAVKKIAAQVGARIFVPEKSMSVEEKQELVSSLCSRFGLKVDDPHVRDSLACALRAYNEMEHKLRQVEGYLNRLELDVDHDRVLMCVAMGNPTMECVEREIESMLSPSEKEEVRAKTESKSQRPGEQRPPEQVSEMRKEVEQLRKRLREVLREKEEVEYRLEEERIMRNKELMNDRRIYRLAGELTIRNKIVTELKEELNQRAAEIQRLKEVVDMLVSGRGKIVRCEGKVQFCEGSLRILGDPVSYKVAVFVGEDYAIVDEGTLKDAEVLAKEREIEEGRKIDLVKLILDYRRERNESKT